MYCTRRHYIPWGTCHFRCDDLIECYGGGADDSTRDGQATPTCVRWAERCRWPTLASGCMKALCGTPSQSLTSSHTMGTELLSHYSTGLGWVPTPCNSGCAVTVCCVSVYNGDVLVLVVLLLCVAEALLLPPPSCVACCRLGSFMVWPPPLTSTLGSGTSVAPRLSQRVHPSLVRVVRCSEVWDREGCGLCCTQSTHCPPMPCAAVYIHMSCLPVHSWVVYLSVSVCLSICVCAGKWKNSELQWTCIVCSLRPERVLVVVISYINTDPGHEFTELPTPNIHEQCPGGLLLSCASHPRSGEWRGRGGGCVHYKRATT